MAPRRATESVTAHLDSEGNLAPTRELTCGSVGGNLDQLSLDSLVIRHPDTHGVAVAGIAARE